MTKFLCIKTFSAIILCSFLLLPCFAQSYTIYNCDFENWTDGKPDGWQFPYSHTISQYTPAYSGSYSCKIEGITSTYISPTQIFKRGGTLFFTAKMIQGNEFRVNNIKIDIDSEWRDYEIELSMSGNSQLRFSAIGTGPGESVGFVIDRVKLVSINDTTYLDVNNISAKIKNNGTLFFTDGPEFEVPKGSGKASIFSSSIWLGGMDEQDQLHVAAMNFGQRGNDFWPGAISQQNWSGWGTPYFYNHLWKVSTEEIAYHKVHYKDLDYKMPWAIANWPANGRDEYDESYHLAPYKNVAGTNAYEPELGDYPQILGDQAIFFLLNDKTYSGGGLLLPHGESGGAPFGVEVLCMAYGYNISDSALKNTIFLTYEIRNRSEKDYKDFYFGWFIDYDLGYYGDDYIGCDTSLNLSYVYNGTEIDGSGESWAYGENPPVQGCIFLNQKMSSCGYFINENSLMGDPQKIDYHYYNRLQGKWNDGTHYTYGGNGYNSESIVYTNFCFSGDPVAGTGWTELTPNGSGSTPNNPGDRRAVMSAGPFAFTTGETITIDIALPFARDYGSKSALSSLALLKLRVPEIQKFYDEEIVGIKENKISTGKLRVYPNPSNGQFTITSEKIIETIELYDIMGKKVFASSPKEQTSQINTRLPQGFYIYRATLEDYSICSGKIVVQ